MKPLKQSVSLSLDKNILEKIKKLSKKQDHSLSQYINLVLKDYIDKHK